MPISGGNTLELIIAARDRTAAAFGKVNSRMGRLEGVSKKVTSSLKNVAKAGVLIGGAAVVAGIVGSTKAFMDFEDAMASVRKTTGFTKDRIKVLGTEINTLALTIPVAQTKLAEIAATAGQLGIKGQKNILEFTETIAKMSTAFDMAANDVAVAMAKLSNIYDIPIEQVGNLGSAINVLGNTTPATEQQIMAFSMALGPTGQQLGFTATEVISLGASMISMGMDASSAGTRLNRAFSMIGQNLGELAGFMGVSVEEFTASFEAMPMETFIGVIDKLSQVEGKLEANTIAGQLFGEIGAKGIKSIAGNVDGLRTNLINTKKEFKDNTSLTEEFAAKTDTLKARFQLLKNSISSLLIDIGGELAPTITTIIDGFRNIIPPLKDFFMTMVSGYGEMFESITRQAGETIGPLIEKITEAGEKMSKGLNFKTLRDDIGVFIGAGLNPLIRGLTWLIDNLGPLWELIGKGAGMFHDLANALKTEEGRLDDILDATEAVTKAKEDLYNINEKLRENTKTLAEELESAGGWTDKLANLQATAKKKTDALAAAQKIAAAAIAEHGAESEIAKVAIKNVELAEHQAEGATNRFTTALDIATTSIIDEGVATTGLEKAHLDFATSTETATEKEGDLVVAIGDLRKEMKEAEVAPKTLGEAFLDFFKTLSEIFLAIPKKIAESFLKIPEIISNVLSTVRESFTKNITKPLSEDIPKAAEATEKAIEDAAHVIKNTVEKTAIEIEEVEDALEDVEEAAEEVGERGKKAFKDIEVQIDETSETVTGLSDDLASNVHKFEELEGAANSLLDLNWDVFSSLEAELPTINAGIGDMESAFVDLEIVLEQNIDKLENVKRSVENISGLAAPFLEAGFLNGIKAIGSFAGALKDAGSAINTFASLQEVSIDGCINFSLHVHDMVSALRILESQMEDLVPAFGDMDSLITGIADAFLYGGDKMEGFVNNFKSNIESANDIMGDSEVSFGNFKRTVDNALDTKTLTYWSSALNTDEVVVNEWKTVTIDSFNDVLRAMEEAKESAKRFAYERTDLHSLTSFFDQSGEQIRYKHG
jgi:TP901 family phage tail tape measure protein